MKSAEIRQKFLEFFASKGHQIVASSSLVPHEDPTMTPEDMAPNDGAVAQGNWKGGDPKNPRV
jgi:hypothetical protein